VMEIRLESDLFFLFSLFSFLLFSISDYVYYVRVCVIVFVLQRLVSSYLEMLIFPSLL